MIVLPFPPAILSGHTDGKGRWAKIKVTKELRALAHEVTWDAKPAIPAKGDIRIHFRLVPPNRRGDRVNMPGRLKPLIDGIADALQVNDSRFLPSYEFAEPEKPGRVEVSFPARYPQPTWEALPTTGAARAVDGLPPEQQEAA